jgi:DNA-directed RNA polymerase specialized sigma subunit
MAQISKKQSNQADNSFKHGLKLEILKDLLPELGEKEMMALHLRFWECMTIHQIAGCLHMTWEATDKLIESTLLTSA